MGFQGITIQRAQISVFVFLLKRSRVVVMKNNPFPKGEKRRRMSLKVVDIYWRLSRRTRRDIAVYVGRAAVRSGGD